MRVFGKTLPPKAASLLGTNIVLLGLCVPLLLPRRGWSTIGGPARPHAAVSVLVRLVRWVRSARSSSTNTEFA
jgi:hypothetical protein